MKLYKPHFEEIRLNNTLKQIERCARVCYKSENRIEEGSDLKIIGMLAQKDHSAMLEHGTVYLKFRTDQIVWSSQKDSTNGAFNKVMPFNDYNYKKIADSPYSRSVYKKIDNVCYVTTNLRVIFENNKDMYDALITLDYEYRNNYLTLPYIVLLDEANLSPMEYYWADFMNICDNINDESIKNQINLGDNYVYNIPPTLRFLATINNDHTTEILSPRLIDRAFIVSLPESYSDIKPDVAKPDYKPVSWENLLDVFIPKEDKKISTKVLEIYKEIKELFLKENIYISPRIDKAVLLYCKTAASLFEEEYGISTDIIGLDYAVSQKLLPKISGNGESYKKWLSDELFNKLEKHNMLKSKFKVADILDSGERRMNYFQYFD